ncbi:MAG: phage tail protein [Cyanobacteria bacterium P01_A01_bin.3]
MTQATLQPALGLNLTPMRVPEAVPVPASVQVPTAMGADGRRTGKGIVDVTSERIRSGTDLLVRPGEPSELVVHLTNSGDRPLEVEIHVEGDCPPQWYSLALESSQVQPRQRVALVVMFSVPSDFFEHQEPLPHGGRLRLDYRAHLRVFANELGSGRQVQEFATVNVAVRPPSLYLDFLPNLYREVDAIGRLLAIFEQAFEPSVQALNTMWAHLDPLTAPEALLPFLAHWVGWSSDARWSIQQQRRLIRRAVEIYRWRGTRRGLRLYLHLYTGLPLEDASGRPPTIDIQEQPPGGLSLGEGQLGFNAIIGGGRPFHFTVTLRPPEDMPLDESLMRTIIEQEKPAFCTYDLEIEPFHDSPELTTSTARFEPALR